MRLDHLLSKESVSHGSLVIRASLMVLLASGIVDEGPAVGLVMSVLPPCMLCVVGVEPRIGCWWWGVAHCWALRNHTPRLPCCCFWWWGGLPLSLLPVVVSHVCGGLSVGGVGGLGG